jgi:phosphotransferase system enzyme I (PtsI)
MRVLRGKPVAPGYAEGWAFLYQAHRFIVPRYAIGRGEVPQEMERFTAALARAVDRLARLESRAVAELGRADADILAAHVALLRSPQFAEQVHERVRSRLENAEQAIEAAAEDLARSLERAEDEYLRARAHDIRGLARWVLRQLAMHADAPLADLPPRSVLVAHELMPSDLLQLNRAHLAGVITEQGGEASHTAILARALGVPYVTGVAAATDQINTGARVLLDGQTGELWISPEADVSAEFARSKAAYDRAIARAIAEEGHECVTLDGVRVSLEANIGRPAEAARAAAHRLDGVGLFRTEFMFLDAPSPPALEHQCAIYREAARQLAGRPLVVRTLDLGGDKQPAFLAPQFAANPKLGARGLRFSLGMARDLFRTQLDALAHVAHDGDVRVLFPMVLGRQDLRLARQLLAEACTTRGIPRPLPAGAMIETPAAVFMIEEILEEADFVSIGTNDLTQFILAADRNARDLIDDYSALHPAVLRAVRQVACAARAAGKPVTVCGEAAADPPAACLLVGLGVSALSMSPASAARVRRVLRAVRASDLERLAEDALGLDDSATVTALARKFVEDVLAQNA